jgi:hypothetical protein
VSPSWKTVCAVVQSEAKVVTVSSAATGLAEAL